MNTIFVRTLVASLGATLLATASFSPLQAEDLGVIDTALATSSAGGEGTPTLNSTEVSQLTPPDTNAASATSTTLSDCDTDGATVSGGEVSLVTDEAASTGNPAGTLTVSGLNVGTIADPLGPETITSLSDSLAASDAVPAGLLSEAVDGPSLPASPSGGKRYLAVPAFYVIIAVPEPGTWAMVALGLGLLYYCRRFRMFSPVGTRVPSRP
jgi:hypothetical protein